ncbi:beta strand repeat-containing protein, partial [Simiduia agarivorans]|uniref:beta strand repeat-containing protein n=1 Tax=Simiduia agarivorans TaxID=447471 RepID=UPI000462B990
MNAFNVRKALAKAINLHRLMMGGLVTGLVTYSSLPIAEPTGGNIVGGDGDISQNGSTTQVNQTSDLMAINWDTFNLAADEKVLYVQPSASALVLNRILDDNASTIHGSIESNGHVLLVNPNGVLFTETASVDVGGIAVSGLDINPADFMNGEYKLMGLADSGGSVINYGTINASSAALVGKRVENHGLIKADVVSLSAADEAVISFDADNMLGVQISRAVLEKESGVDSAVLNAGSIEGQRVLLDASVAKDLFDAAVNNTGTVVAKGINTTGGVIRLSATGGAVSVSGLLDASGTAGVGGEVFIQSDSSEVIGNIKAEGSSGGSVKVLGSEVTLRSASTISADGTDAGGAVLLGGGYRGSVDSSQGEISANTTVIESGAVVSASATGSGDGGLVVAWANENLEFLGELRATGAGEDGNGGEVETSGQQSVLLGGVVATEGGANGNAGEWTINPGYLEIGNENKIEANYLYVGTLQNELADGSVTISSNALASDGSLNGQDNTASGIRLLTDISIASSHTLTLEATGTPVGQQAGIYIGGNIQAIAGENPTLELISNANIDIAAGMQIDLNDGIFVASAQGSFTNFGIISADEIEINVGLSGNGSTNILGELYYNTGNQFSLDVDGGDGLDTFDISQISLPGGVWNRNNGNGRLRLQVSSTSIVRIADAEGFFTSASDVALDLAGVTDITVQQNGTALALSASGQSFEGFSSVATVSGANLTYQVVDLQGEEAVWITTANDAGSQLASTQVRVTALPNDSTGGILFERVAAASGFRRLRLSSEFESINLSTDASNQFNSIDFNLDDLEEIDGVSGGDTIIGGDSWQLTDAGAIASVSGASVTVLGVNSVASAGVVFGKVGADSLEFSGSTLTDTSTGIEYLSVSRVDAGAAIGDTLVVNDTSTWTLGTSDGAAVGATLSGVEFVGIDTASYSAGNHALTGSASVDNYQVTGANTLLANDMSFENIGEVVALDGNDQLSAGGAQVNVSVAVAERNGIEFTGLQTIANATVHAQTDLALTLGVADGDFTSAGLVFTGITAVSAETAVNLSVTGGSWTLSGASGAASSNGIGFTNLDNVDSSGSVLSGSDGNDAYSFTSIAGPITANGIAFTGVTTVNTRDGSDTVTGPTSGTINWVSLGDKAARYDGLVFNQIETLVDDRAGATLTATNGIDALSVGFTKNLITLNGVTFENASDYATLDLNGGGDQLNLAGNTVSVSEAGALALADGLAITNLTSAIGGAITLTDVNVQSLTLDLNDDFAYAGITFVNAERLAASNGSSITSTNASSIWGFGGDDLQLVGAITTVFEGFNNVTSAADSVNGGAVADQYTASANNLGFVLNGVSFSHAAGFDQVILNNGNLVADQATLAGTGADNRLLVASIEIDGVETAAVASLAGESGQSETYSVTGSGLLTTRGIDFSSLASVTAVGGADAATTSSDWTLLDAASQQARTQGITFTGLETAGGNFTGLDLSATTADLTYNGSQHSIDIAGASIRFDSNIQLTSLVGNGAGSLNVSGAQIQLDNAQNVALASGPSVTGISLFSNGSLLGSSVAEQFNWDGTTLTLAGGSLQFSNLSQVNTAGGDDTVTSTGAEWTLITGGARSNGLSFLNIETATGNGVVNGTSGSDSFQMTGTTLTDTTTGIDFMAVTRVNAGAGPNDTVLVMDTASWTLGTGDGDSVGARLGAVEFVGIETANYAAGTHTLTGSASQDNYQVAGTNSVSVNGMTFNGIATVAASGGDDQLNAAGAEVAVNGGEVARDGVNFLDLHT